MPSASNTHTSLTARESDIPSVLGELPVLQIAGDALERGERYGELVRATLPQALEVYRGLWTTLPNTAIESLVDQQLKLTQQFFPEIFRELQGVARGAHLSLVDVMTLNGRTEITLLHYLAHAVRATEEAPPPSECTLVGSAKMGILAENWDWAQSIARIMTLVHYTESDGTRILTLTEPGILAKVGMNSHGLAVGLNFIPGAELNTGIPVHILLRATLSKRSVSDVGSMLESLKSSHALGTCSSISVVDAKGDGECFEILGSDLIRTRLPGKDGFVHTNHMNLDPNRFEGDHLPDSLARLSDATSLLEAQDLTVERAKQILADRENCAFKINMPPANWGAIGLVETIRSLVFDCKRGEFHISRGLPGSQAVQPQYDVFRFS